MNQYFIAIDQSTTSTKVFLLDQQGNIIDRVAKKHRQIYPQNGWVEHDPNEIYNNLMQLMKQILKKHERIKEDIISVSISNQRETALIWDHKSGEPLYRAIVWQCQRTINLCENLKEYEEIVHQKTGLKINPYFSATKWMWLLEHVDLNDKVVLLGTMDAWLVYKLSNRLVHACDHSNASRTLLYNLETGTWDRELLDIFHIDEKMLPEIKASDEVFGYTNLDGLLDMEIPIIGVMGDSQAALYAQHCIHPGDVKITLGTGSSVLMNQGNNVVVSNQALVHTLAWKLEKETMYATEAIIQSCGDTLNWLRDELGMFQSDDELNNITRKELREEQVILIPSFQGMALPYWRSDVQASIQGISRSTTKRNMICAGLCSIAYQLNDALTALHQQSGIPLGSIMVDGGVSQNKTLMQFISDVCNYEIRVKKQSNLSAMGAYQVALHHFHYPEVKQEKLLVYRPSITKQKRIEILERWIQAIKKL